MCGLKAHSLCDAVSKYSTVIWLVGLAWVKTNKQTKKIIQNLYVTSSSQFFHHSMVLCLWKCGPVIISVTHHHPQLHRFGNLPAVGTLNHNADMKLSKQKRWKKKKKQRGNYIWSHVVPLTLWVTSHATHAPINFLAADQKKGITCPVDY